MTSLFHHSSESGGCQDRADALLFAWSPRAGQIVGDAAAGAEEEVCLQNNHMRHFDPTVGQWLSEEPIGFAASDENLRKYVGK